MGADFACSYHPVIVAVRLGARTNLAPLLQVFYYLRELDEALNYALGAGNAFDINGKSEYVSTIIGTSSLLLPIIMIDTGA